MRAIEWFVLVCILVSFSVMVFVIDASAGNAPYYIKDKLVNWNFEDIYNRIVDRTSDQSIGGKKTFTGKIKLPTITTALVGSSSPTDTGLLYYNTDNNKVYVSTGTSVGQYLQL